MQMICTTVTGLQSLMNVANSYVKDHGLRFNANKTSGFIMGSNPFTTVPKWSIDNVSIKLQDNLNYLGAKFSKQGGAAHCDERAHKAINAFYALQGAGVKYPGVCAPIAFELYCSQSEVCLNMVVIIKPTNPSKFCCFLFLVFIQFYNSKLIVIYPYYRPQNVYY